MFSKVALLALATGAQVSLAAPVQDKRAGKALIPLLVGGGASLLTSEVLNNKRAESGLMLDSKTGVVYMKLPSISANEGRSLPALAEVVPEVITGVFSGAAGAVASDFFENYKRNLYSGSEPIPNISYGGIRPISASDVAVIDGILGNTKRTEDPSLMIDNETGVLYTIAHKSSEARSLKVLPAIITAAAGGVASAVAGSVTTDVLDNYKREESNLMVDTGVDALYMVVPNTNEGRSLPAVADVLVEVVGSVAGSAASTAVDYVHDNYKREELSERALIPLLISSFFNKRSEDIDARSFTAIKSIYDDIFGKRSEDLDARSYTAIKDLFNDVFGKRSDELDARSLSYIGNVLKDVFGKRSEELDARSVTAIKGILGNLFNRRAELEEIMAKRSINDLE